MLAAVKLSQHYSLYVASVEGVPQDPLVRLSRSTPSGILAPRSGRGDALGSVRIATTRLDGSGIDHQEQRA